MKYVREIFFFLSSMCRIDHMFFCCVLLYSTGLFFCFGFGFFLTASAIYSLGVLSFTIAFLKPFFLLLISLEITYLNIYTHNNKFFFVCFDSCMRYFNFVFLWIFFFVFVFAAVNF